MATMGVRVNQGLGSTSSTALADTLAKALFGDAETEMDLALGRSRLATDEYTRRQIQSAEHWNNIRAQREAAELHAQKVAADANASVMQQFLERAIPAPPLGTPGVEYSPEQNWPEPVQIGTTAIPTPTPRPNIESEGWPAPVEVPGMEPDFEIRGYPMRSDALPNQAPIPQFAPLAVEPNLDAALVRRQPPITTGFLSPYGPEAPYELGGRPPDLQTVQTGEPSPPVPIEENQLTRTLIPGRPTVETREVQGPPVPVEVAPAGPPTATGDYLSDTMPVPVEPQAMPGDPIMAEVQGPPIPVPAGQVEKNPDGTVSIGTNHGNITLTPEQYAAFGQQIAFSTDPGKQMQTIVGGIDIMDRGLTPEGATLATGTVPARASILGTEEQIKVDAAQAASTAATDPKKDIQVVDNVPYQVFKDENGVAHFKMVSGFTVPGKPPLAGEGENITHLNTLITLNQKLNSGQPLTPEETLTYRASYNAAFGPKTTTSFNAAGEQQASTIVPEPPDDFRTPDQLTPGPIVASPAPVPAPVPATDAATPAPVSPASPAPAVVAPAPVPAPVPADVLANERPAEPGAPLTVQNVRGEAVPVKGYGGWTQPGEKPPVRRNESTVPGATVTTTTFGDKKNVQMTVDAGKQLRHIAEAIPAMHYLNSIYPGDEPGVFQNALQQWSTTGISQELLANPALDDATREYGRAILNFINAPKRTESGAAVSAQEVLDYRTRFSMAPGGGKREYLSAREARTAYLKAARQSLNEQVPPDMLRGLDTDLAKYDIDLDWMNPNVVAPETTAPGAEKVWTEKQNPDGTTTWVLE